MGTKLVKFDTVAGHFCSVCVGCGSQRRRLLHLLQHSSHGAGRRLEGLGNQPVTSAPCRIRRIASTCWGRRVGGRPRTFPCRRARSRPSLVRRLMEASSWSATQDGEHGQDLAEEGLRAALLRLQEARPPGLGLRHEPDLPHGPAAPLSTGQCPSRAGRCGRWPPPRCRRRSDGH